MTVIIPFFLRLFVCKCDSVCCCCCCWFFSSLILFQSWLVRLLVFLNRFFLSFRWAHRNDAHRPMPCSAQTTIGLVLCASITQITTKHKKEERRKKCSNLFSPHYLIQSSWSHWHWPRTHSVCAFLWNMCVDALRLCRSTLAYILHWEQHEMTKPNRRNACTCVMMMFNRIGFMWITSKRNGTPTTDVVRVCECCVQWIGKKRPKCTRIIAGIDACFGSSQFIYVFFFLLSFSSTCASYSFFFLTIILLILFRIGWLSSSLVFFSLHFSHDFNCIDSWTQMGDINKMKMVLILIEPRARKPF